MVGRVGPGGVIGDVEMFLRRDYLASARCVEDVTAIRLRREAIVGELAEHPRIALRWMIEALRQLDRCNRRVVSLLRKSVKGRVAAFLLEEGEVNLSHGEMAGLLGVSRPALSRALGELRRQGVIRTGRRWIRLVDAQAARRTAEEERR